MGYTLFTQDSAWIDPDWIVNVTTNVVGKKSLDLLAQEPSSFNKGYELRRIFFHQIEERLQGMNNTTLGRIVGYGGRKGTHTGSAVSAPFLNRTGYDDLFEGDGFENWTVTSDDDSHPAGDRNYAATRESGRQILEYYAALTIICVLRDIRMQTSWQIDVQVTLEEEADFDVGMRRYVHSKPVVR